MTPEENKALARRFYAEIDKGNLAAMDELVAENYIDHNPLPSPAWHQGGPGLEAGFRNFLESDTRVSPR